VSQALTVRIAFAICALLMLASAVACDPGHSVTWVNETGRTVSVFAGDDPEDLVTTLSPHSSKELGELKHLWEDVVVVKDEDGSILSRKEITWEELKAQDWRIVITEEMLAPTPTEGR
jgi:hypothetical protein